MNEAKLHQLAGRVIDEDQQRGVIRARTTMDVPSDLDSSP